MEALELTRVMSQEEYLELEMASEVRHEYVGGQVWAMAGGTNDHATICFNLNGTLFAGLAGKPCRGGGSEQRIRVESTGDAYYADAQIQCPPLRFYPSDPNGLMNPRVIFEVLSPSTEDYDRTTKFLGYRSIVECSDYVLISSRRVFVEHYRRINDLEWTRRDYVWRREELVLENFELTIPLEQIYRDIEVPEGMIVVKG